MLTYQLESFESFYAGAQELMEEHHREVARDKAHLQVSLDLPRYRVLDARGELLILTARHEGKMIGYLMVALARHPHYAVRCGFEDAHFLSKSYRQGLRNPWFRLVELAENLARELGLFSLTIHSKPSNRAGEVLELLGYPKSDELHTKVL